MHDIRSLHPWKKAVVTVNINLIKSFDATLCTHAWRHMTLNVFNWAYNFQLLFLVGTNLESLTPVREGSLLNKVVGCCWTRQ